jgi:phosphoribosylformylglycinamidine synthase
LLDAPNSASKRWAFRQYDWLVGSNTVIGPGSDGAVLRVKGTSKALALSVDCNSRYCELDPYVGAMTAVVEAARNVVCAGAEPIGLTDCLNFGNPEKPEIMWQFREAVRGIRDACTVLGIPVVSGNVSFYNETDGARSRRHRPSPWSGCSRTSPITPQWFNRGDVVLLLGAPANSAAASTSPPYTSWCAAPPWIDLAVEMQAQKICLQAIAGGWCGRRTTCPRAALPSPAEACISGRTSRSGPRSRWKRRSVPTPGSSARASRGSCCRCGASTSIGCAISPAPPTFR